jgi:hypothetical protein
MFVFLFAGYTCDAQTIHNINNDLTCSDMAAGSLIQVTPSYVANKLSPPSILRRGSRHKRRRSKSSEQLSSSSDFILPDHPPTNHMVSGCEV